MSTVRLPSPLPPVFALLPFRPGLPPTILFSLQVEARRRALEGDVVVSVSAESFILRSLSGSTRLDSVSDRGEGRSLSTSFGEGKSEEWVGKSLEQEASTAPATASNGASDGPEYKVSHLSIYQK